MVSQHYEQITTIISHYHQILYPKIHTSCSNIGVLLIGEKPKQGQLIINRTHLASLAAGNIDGS